MRMLSVDYLSADCLSHPLSGTRGQNTRKSNHVVFMGFFGYQSSSVSAFWEIFEFLLLKKKRSNERFSHLLFRT